jgi:hypothetical protein
LGLTSNFVIRHAGLKAQSFFHATFSSLKAAAPSVSVTFKLRYPVCRPKGPIVLPRSISAV